MRYLLALLATLSALGLAGCSDSPGEASPEREDVAPVTSGTTEDPEARAFLRDFVAIRGAIDLAGWRNYEGLYYATVDYARRIERTAGAALLHRELPAVLENVIDESRHALTGIQAVSPETRYGGEFRALQIETLTFNIQAFTDLHDRFAPVANDAQVASGWTEFEAWANQTNPRIEELDKRLDGFYRRLPPSLREAFDRGVAAFRIGS